MSAVYSSRTLEPEGIVTTKAEHRARIARLEADKEDLQERLNDAESEVKRLDGLLRDCNQRSLSAPERLLSEGRSILSALWPWP